MHLIHAVIHQQFYPCCENAALLRQQRRWPRPHVCGGPTPARSPPKCPRCTLAWWARRGGCQNLPGCCCDARSTDACDAAAAPLWKAGKESTFGNARSLLLAAWTGHRAHQSLHSHTLPSSAPASPPRRTVRVTSHQALNRLPRPPPSLVLHPTMPQTIVSPRAGLAQLKQVGFGLRRRVCTIRKPSPCLRNGLEACCKCHAWGLCTRRSLVKAPAAAVMPLRIAADARSRLALPAGCRCRRRRPRLLRVVGLCGRGPAARQEALPARLHRLPAGERRLRRAPGRAGGCPQPARGS